MRSIRQLPVPQDPDNNKWPYGQIKNETETESGTPVVREIYGDPLTNIYKILEDAGVTPNGNEDSEQSGYQLLEAFKKFANALNDIEQTLTLTADVYSINMNIDHLPDRYVLIARSASNYVNGGNYSFKGNDNLVYSLTSETGFKAGDEVLIIIDKSKVRVYSLSFLSNSDTEIFPVFGNPVPFNDTTEIYYESSGRILTDTPSISDLQQIIRVFAGVGTLYVNEIFVLKGHVLCSVFDTNIESYSFYQFEIGDLETPISVSMSGFSFPTGINRNPYIYTDGDNVFISNSTGNSDNDYEFDRAIFNPLDSELVLTGSFSLANTFKKTTNAVISSGSLITFIDGELKRYLLSTGLETFLGGYNAMNGIIFKYNDSVYYTNGNVAKKWNL